MESLEEIPKDYPHYRGADSHKPVGFRAIYPKLYG